VGHKEKLGGRTMDCTTGEREIEESKNTDQGMVMVKLIIWE
jgi:hypothetical protein